MMRKGRFVGGVIIIDAPASLEEGTEVTVILPEKETDVVLTDEQEDELAKAVAECDRGEAMDAREFLKQLRGEQSGKSNS